MKPTSQRGFAAVEAVIIVVIIVALVAGGYYVYHANQSSKHPPAQPVQSAKPAATSPATTLKVAPADYLSVPADLQQAILQAQKSAGCVKDGQIVDLNGEPTDQNVIYATSGYAITAIGCDSPAASLFAKLNGGWQTVDSTQFAFSCDKLKKYNVPVELLQVANSGQPNPTNCLPTPPPSNNAPLPSYTGPNQNY
ncbi:MAG: hypothetical protein ACREGF_00435 [Candidatus Saccharimonadales bacterium]